MAKFKRIISCILVVTVAVMCATMVSCKKKKQKKCTHQWIEASCTSPLTCSLCKTTIGSALGHTGGQATCLSSAVCTRCNLPYGQAAGHSWVEGTCTDERYCSVCYTEDGINPDNHYGTTTWVKTANGHSQGYACCGVVYGEEQPHTLVGGRCSYCDFAPTVTVSNVNASVGQTVTVTINLADNPGLTGMQITIRYDASKLTLTEAVNGAALEGLTFTASDNLGNGAKCIWDGMNVISGTGTIVTLTFVVSANATQGDYNIVIDAKGYDDDLATVNFVVNNGIITVA